ncbi:MAG TPA: SDR family oxidoreductase [Terrimicrobiaceae bacterium]|nr:SDR family oxidoreductase [Terrimicrobiaceae bacterium]
MNPFSLDGETALITGGGTGLGLGMARSFVEAGARVILIGRNDQRLRAACGDLGPSAAWIGHDITRLSEAGDLIRRASSVFPDPPGILINNAGTHLKKSAVETSSDEFEALMRTHVSAGHALAAAMLPGMLQRGRGSIVFIASMASFLGVPNVFAYSAAKTAVLGMTRALAGEVSGRGVRVNAIAPGWIETDMVRKALDNDPVRKAKVLGRTPLGSLGQPADVGAAAVYLCSPAARFVTGTTLVVDGGASVGF